MRNGFSQYVLIDRDGVINEDRPGSVLSRTDFALLPDVPEAIALLNASGYGVLVITNQACVGRGDLEPMELEAIHREMQQRVATAGGRIEEIYVCPHTDEDGCDCRKPRPGLIEQAHRDFGFSARDTWLVGDDLRDVEAALAAGCKPALVLTGKAGGGDRPPGVPVFRNLMDFAKTISSTEQTT